MNVKMTTFEKTRQVVDGLARFSSNAAVFFVSRYSVALSLPSGESPRR